MPLRDEPAAEALPTVAPRSFPAPLRSHSGVQSMTRKLCISLPAYIADRLDELPARGRSAFIADALAKRFEVMPPASVRAKCFRCLRKPAPHVRGLYRLCDDCNRLPLTIDEGQNGPPYHCEAHGFDCQRPTNRQTRECERCKGSGLAVQSLSNDPNRKARCNLCGGNGYRDASIPIDGTEPQ